MFNPQEQKIIDYGKQNGKSRQEVEKALMSYRTGQKPKPAAPAEQGTLSEAWSDIKQTGSALKNTATNTYGKMGEAVAAGIEGKQSPLKTLGQSVGAGLGGISQGIGDVIVGGVKTILPQRYEDKIKKGVSDVVTPIMQSNTAKNIVAKYEALDPVKKRDVDAILGAGSFIADVAGAGLFKKGASSTFKVGKEAVDTSIDAAKRTAQNTVEKAKSLFPNTKTITESGLFQKGKELTERGKRGVVNTLDDIEASKLKAEKIRVSPPAVGNAIKADLPEILIDGITKADQPTIRAMKKTLDLAETPSKLGLKVQPSSVSGELAVKQFNIIDNQRKAIGAKLGSAVDELSKTVKVPMQPAYKQLDDILTQLDIVPVISEEGSYLDFSKAAFSKAQKSKIEELYNLAHEGGKTLTPAQIYKKDRLFSQLNREAKMSEIGDIMVTLPGMDKPKSLFSVFKDVYSKTLDDVSPQDIRALNTEYRKYRTMVDTIEDTLLRGSKNIDDVSLIKKNPAEFAKVNLRRMFGEAGSSAEFAAVANDMDKLARALGYADASPALISDFANELRKIYPNTIPATGFQGGIKMGVRDIANQLISIGEISPKDQQKALRELIESLYDNKASIIKPKTATPIAAQIPQIKAIKTKIIARKSPIV